MMKKSWNEITNNKMIRKKENHKRITYIANHPIKTIDYINNKKHYIMLNHKLNRNKKLTINTIIDNIIINEKIEYHHITNNILFAIPRDLHKLYSNPDINKHRFMCNEIVKQIYINVYE